MAEETALGAAVRLTIAMEAAADAQEAPRTWTAPVRLYAGRRSEA